jgi:hypothetical protein
VAAASLPRNACTLCGDPHEAHTRRAFERAKDIEPEAVAEALTRIGALYACEQAIREQNLVGAEKVAYRNAHARPIVEAFFTWADAAARDAALLPSNPLTKALHYALERRSGLGVYLDDPDVPIDTNHLERALRPIPMGRRNWLFCWSEVGAEAVATIQSLLVSCRLQEVDPYDYLVDVLQRIDTHPAKDVEQLIPRRWKQHFAADPLRSKISGLKRNPSYGETMRPSASQETSVPSMISRACERRHSDRC